MPRAVPWLMSGRVLLNLSVGRKERTSPSLSPSHRAMGMPKMMPPMARPATIKTATGEA